MQVLVDTSGISGHLHALQQWYRSLDSKWKPPETPLAIFSRYVRSGTQTSRVSQKSISLFHIWERRGKTSSQTMKSPGANSLPSCSPCSYRGKEASSQHSLHESCQSYTTAVWGRWKETLFGRNSVIKQYLHEDELAEVTDTEFFSILLSA